MGLRQEVEHLVKYAKNSAPYLAHNTRLFNAYEGDLLSQIEEDLAEQFSPESLKQVKHRVSPINLLKKIVDKLSKIYANEPRRLVVDGTDQDSELLKWYEDNFKVNRKLNGGNEFYNLFKNCLIQPYVDNGKPRIRIIPSNQYNVLSMSPVDNMKPTHVILHFCRTDALGVPEKVFQIYTDTEFLIVNEKNEILVEEMAAVDNAEGVNIFGVLPFVYASASENLLTPLQDTDMLKMVKLIPILLSDLNYAVMYQSFSMIYGIDVDDQDIKAAPSAFLRFKSDANSDKKPEIGFIKPQVEIEPVLSLVQTELSMWLNSKGIKPGAIGTLTMDNMASGISKMIDEMDTFEERKKQVVAFKDIEAALWDLVFRYMHPVWSKTGKIENKAQFTSTAHVDTIFAEQTPMVRRGELVADLALEVEKGFLPKARAVAKLNSQMSPKEVEELLAEIHAEKAEAVANAAELIGPAVGAGEQDEEQEPEVA